MSTQITDLPQASTPLAEDDIILVIQEGVAKQTAQANLINTDIQSDWDETNSGNQAYIKHKPTLGTAAALDAGTSANQVVQLDGSAKLPAVDGSQLTNLPAAGVSSIASNGSLDVSGATGDITISIDQDHDNTWNGDQTFDGVVNIGTTTASTALVTDGSKNVVSSSTTSTELGYVHGVTSSIQDQLDAKIDLSDSYTDGQILIGNSNTGGLQAATITNGSGISVTNGHGSITVGLGATTGSGAIVLATSPTLVTPALGTPTAIVLTNATGTASGLTAGHVTTNANLTGDVTSSGNATSYNTTVPINKGGTGETVANDALNALLPSQATNANKFLMTDGTNTSWDTAGSAVSITGSPSNGELTKWTGGTSISNGNLSGIVTTSDSLVTSFGTFSSSALAAALSDETGTGSVVFSDSPTLVTPALGTPSALVGTNITGTASGLTAGTATVASTVSSANEATDTTCFPLFITASGTQSLQPKNNTSLTFNSNTGALGATSFSGSGTGLTGTASSLTAGAVTNATLTTALTVNTGTLTLTANAANNSVLTIGAGAVSVSGSNTGDQTNISGNAGTVTNGIYTTDTGTVTNTMLAGSIANNKLSNSSVTVNGTSIALGASGTVTAAAGTLTGTTLAAGVTASSLTSFGAGIALGTPASGTLTNCTFPTLNQNTSGSAASLSISGQSGLLTFSGLTSSNRAKTVRDAADTILELGGSYTPSGTWTNLTMITPTLGAATATSINKMAITAPASSSTLAVADGKTFTASNTITLTGTDSVSANVSNLKIRTIGFSAYAPTTGQQNGYYAFPVAGTITGWKIIVDAGTATVTTWKVASGTTAPTVSNSISTSGVAISTGSAIISTDVSDFTSTTVTANDIFAFNISAVSGVTRLTFELQISVT